MPPLTGNQPARDALAAAMASGTLHHAWLLAGPEGVGKASFARAAALRMLAEAAGTAEMSEGWDVPCDSQPAHLFASAVHPDYFELARLPKSVDPAKLPHPVLARVVGPEREAVLQRQFAGCDALTIAEAAGEKGESLRRSIVVEQVRALISMLSNRPSLSARRVIVVDPAEALERNGANALLKSLEEPPAGTIFLLVSHAPGRLLPTIRSRCRLLRFDPLAPAEVASVLRERLPDATASEIEALVRAGEGSPGRALGFAGLDLAALEADMAAIAETGDPSNAIRVRLSKLLGAKAAQPRYEAFLARAPGFIADRTRALTGEPLRTALDAYDKSRELAGAALGLSLDAGGTVFEMGGVIARLAPR